MKDKVNNQVLSDFLISSVDDSKDPKWTEKHIDELLSNFDIYWKDDNRNSNNKEYENAKHICKEIIRTNMFNRNTDANAIEIILKRAETCIPIEFLKKELKSIQDTLENEYSAEKVADIFNGATYREKFMLLGQEKMLKLLIRSIENGEF